MSDTPRTDAAKKIVLGWVGGDWEVVHIAFSRELERELAAANERIKRLEEAGDVMWSKAGPFIVRDVILDDGDTEVPIREVDPDFQIRDEEAPTAREIVALIDAVDGWTQAKGAK